MEFDDNGGSTEDKVQKLTAVLEQNTTQLETMPSVTGWGVGLSELDDLNRIVIKVYVASPAAVPLVQDRLGEPLSEYPLEVVYLPTLTAL